MPRSLPTARRAQHYVGEYKDPSVPAIEIAPEKFSFFGPHFADKPLLQRLNYLHLTILTAIPVLTLYGLFTVEHTWRTWAWAVGYYFFSGFGITAGMWLAWSGRPTQHWILAHWLGSPSSPLRYSTVRAVTHCITGALYFTGYHRLFAHKAFKATPFLSILLMCMGSAAVQGSVRWWCRDHRAHHKYVDTEKDPYPSTLGFWHAHMGWMLVKQDKTRIGRVAIPDLDEAWYIRAQHKHYLWFAAFFGLALPTLVAGLGWGDYAGGFFIAGCARLLFVHHSTFCVNSLAHWAGDLTYSDAHTARNSWLTALVTVGEGYHNMHHERPHDYRNGVEWYQYDPTKWFIWTLSKLGLAYDLIVTPREELKKSEAQMQHKNLTAKMAGMYWGPATEDLPSMTVAQVQAGAKEGKPWLMLDGYVVDCGEFAADHPGGSKLVTSMYGKDATDAFTASVYKHSNAAHNLMHTMRVGVVSDAKKHA